MEFEVLSPRHLPFFLFVSLQMRLFSSTKKANVTAQGAEEDDAEEICVKPLNALYLVDFCGLHVASAWHLPHRRRAKPDHLLISTVLQNVDTWSKQQQQSALLLQLQRRAMNACFAHEMLAVGSDCTSFIDGVLKMFLWLLLHHRCIEDLKWNLPRPVF